ncbi:hypothetical protein ACQP2U_43075 (plasmid) [Nocardia sp. CA-084685]|uniref:hypothetical protein n=1 Tax=Nocardia sp. CA-084685 TaxID=3239970 RepID=UPI003D95FA91
MSTVEIVARMWLPMAVLVGVAWGLLTRSVARGFWIGGAIALLPVCGLGFLVLWLGPRSV